MQNQEMPPDGQVAHIFWVGELRGPTDAPGAPDNRSSSGYPARRIVLTAAAHGDSQPRNHGSR